MTTPTATTCQCGKPTRDHASVCDACIETLEKALTECEWIDEQIQTSITGQRAASLEGGSASANRGLPWNERASKARQTLHAELVSWVRFATEERLAGAPDWLPRNQIPSLARWLLHVTRALARHELGGDAQAQITDAIAECERIVFWKRRSWIYLGRCEQVVRDDDDQIIDPCCPGDVYAEENNQVGHCEECGQGVTVVIRKELITKQLDDRLLTAAEAATGTTSLGALLRAQLGGKSE